MNGEVAAGEALTFEYELPSLGADMDEGRVVEWRVGVGDTVHRGDVVAIVETEKSDIDIEIWTDGVVVDLLVDVNELIPVGTPVMRLRAIGAAPQEFPPQESAPSDPASEERAEVVDDGGRAQDVVPAGRVRASPLARRLAAERDVDLGSVHGSGPDGAVVRADLDTAVPATMPVTDEPGGEKPAAKRDPTDAMRGLIAERMSTSNREIPHYHLERDVDLTVLLAWLEESNTYRPIAGRVLPAAVYIRAVALAAARHPEVNGFWVDGGFEPGEAVNVAMAISLRRGGLVTPHIADADDRDLDEIMEMLRERVAASRTGSLRGSWMTGSTITITNLGDTGADLVHGVISPPQVALVGFGRVSERPWVVDGDVVARSIVTVSLAADHRATDGATGSRFLTTLAELLEHPEEL